MRCRITVAMPMSITNSIGIVRSKNYVDPWTSIHPRRNYLDLLCPDGVWILTLSIRKPSILGIN
jgi:hypothetical protein